MSMFMSRYLRIICTVVVLAGWLLCPPAAAAMQRYSIVIHRHAFHAGVPATLFLAQADHKPQRDTEAKPKPKPKSGDLVMPSDYNQGQKTDKKEQTCIRVCSDWGETCVYDINKGRQCRRTCKETTMECFDK